VYRDTGDFDRSYMLYQQTAALVSEGTDRAEVAVVLNSLAQAYRLQGLYSKAGVALRQARPAAAGYRLAQLQLTEAICLTERGRYKNAAPLLDEALATFERGGARYQVARVLFHRALLEFRRGQLAKSDQTLSASLGALEQIGYWQFLSVEAPRVGDFVARAAERGIGEGFLDRLAGRAPAAPPRSVRPRPAPRRPAKLVARALGRVEVSLGGRAIPAHAWGTQSARELLFYLLLHPDGTPKERIMTVLAPDISPVRANAKFHMAAYRLRRALYKGCIQFDGDIYRLDSELEVDFDVDRFRAALAAGWDKPAVLQHALSQYGGLFLDGCYSDWAISEQERLEQQFLDACGRLAALHLHAGEHRDAVAVCERGLAIDDSIEELQSLLLQARQGRRLHGVDGQEEGRALTLVGRSH
jgi:DNA-binding SARP family transcriptional activator